MRSNRAFRGVLRFLSAVLAVSLVFGALPAAASAAPAPAATGTMQFLCKDSAGNVVPGVSLALYRDEALTGKAGNGTADNSGIVRITGLGTATYWVTISSVPAGFEKTDAVVPVGAVEGKVSEYTLVFQKSGVAASEDDDNASLAGLSASVGKLSPAFGAGTATYTLTLPNTQSWVKVTPKLASRYATWSITVNDKRAGKTLTLRAGAEKTMVIRVRAQAGNTKTYTVKIRRAISHSANLVKIGINAGSMQPAFSAGVNAYSVTLPASRGNVTLSVKKGDIYQLYWVRVNGRISAKTISLGKGETKTVTVTVKAQAGETKNYVIRISRAK